MADLHGKKIAILATGGFEQSELAVPLEKLRHLGATVHVVSPEMGSIRGWKGGDWGDDFPVDIAVSEVAADDYDALVLPGGQINPDRLRLDRHAVELVASMAGAGKPVGAICHGPWMLIEAGVVAGREVTSWPSLRTDLTNAGATWVDRETVVSGNLITSRNPDDLPAFVDAVAKRLAEAGGEAADAGGSRRTA